MNVPFERVTCLKPFSKKNVHILTSFATSKHKSNKEIKGRKRQFLSNKYLQWGSYNMIVRYYVSNRSYAVMIYTSETLLALQIVANYNA